jgi:hypothetical protein
MLGVLCGLNVSTVTTYTGSVQTLYRLCVNNPSEGHKTELKLWTIALVSQWLKPFDAISRGIFTIYTPAASLRSNSPYLQTPTKTSNKLLHTLFYRSVDAWNALPVALRSVSSLFMFKSELRTADLFRYLKGSIFN